MTFAASANPVVYTGVVPVFVDSGADGNLDPDLLITAIDTLRAEGTHVIAAMSVDRSDAAPTTTRSSPPWPSAASR